MKNTPPKKQSRVQPNTDAIKSLKDKGYFVKITHFRQVGVRCSDNKIHPAVVEDYIWRKSSTFTAPLPLGGMTTLFLRKGGWTGEVEAFCHPKDHYCKKIGVRECLKQINFENLP